MENYTIDEYYIEYDKRYPNGCGPSTCSYCENPNDDDNCGCWVHRIKNWKKQNITEKVT
jgi:hypothetical protein